MHVQNVVANDPSARDFFCTASSETHYVLFPIYFNEQENTICPYIF
jgi:hypothetical protein